ncbi:hypothetical protein M422DRAFT_256581 [Sphaerobolus stellatus SS14]|uniref:Uncharacterized protein n=1 Tax=Sphaerobolus stellatus (strain SS14) TaxID=990650 RepID=A0A0C9V0H9_SPHS4|nr:hypothetical protein M422DRAFT_256581 [Sphaerobolus stellatus SS14]
MAAANMHLSGAVTYVLVSQYVEPQFMLSAYHSSQWYRMLFLNLRFAAYRSERSHTRPEDINCSLGIWRTQEVPTKTRKTGKSRFLPDLSSFAEFHAGLPEFDTYCFSERGPENYGDE